MRRSMDTMSGTENNSTMSSSLGLAAADDVKVFEGGCMCKAVRFQYSYSADTKPLFVCFCHCETCRKFNSTSMQHLMGVPLSAFSITQGEELLKEYKALDNKFGMYRKFCSICGTGVYQGPTGAPFCGTFPTTFDFAQKNPDDNRLPPEFSTACHINMENSLVGDVVKDDRLPKFVDFPEGLFDGSGRVWDAPV